MACDSDAEMLAAAMAYYMVGESPVDEQNKKKNKTTVSCTPNKGDAKRAGAPANTPTKNKQNIGVKKSCAASKHSAE